MQSGLQLFLANGAIQLDLSRRLPRQLGVANLSGASSGSITVPEFSNAQGWFTPLLGALRTTITLPIVRIEGNVLRWEWPSGRAGAPIIYGIM